MYAHIIYLNNVNGQTVVLLFIYIELCGFFSSSACSFVCIWIEQVLRIVDRCRSFMISGKVVVFIGYDQFSFDPQCFSKHLNTNNKLYIHWKICTCEKPILYTSRVGFNHSITPLWTSPKLTVSQKYKLTHTKTTHNFKDHILCVINDCYCPNMQCQ